MKVFIVFLVLAVVLTSAFELKYDINGEVPHQAVAPRVSNGVSAKPGQFKFIVRLDIRQRQLEFWCGGSLIAPNWILTAAHCIDGATAVYAFMGSTDFSSGRYVPMQQGIIHGGWNRDSTANDISLLRFASFKMGPNIALVSLPPRSGSMNSYINEKVIAIGWGATSDKDANHANELQYAPYKVVPDSVCSSRYGSNVYRDTNICAEGEIRSSTCKGDSGGPLVTESGVLVGITSYGEGCAKGYAGSYTRVSSYRSWIYGITGV